MNPVSFYYCFDDSGQRLETIVAEITNTPWKERHRYVLPVTGVGASAGANARLRHFEFDKGFHVSPFMPMDMQYHWFFNEPQQRLFVHMRNFKDGTPLFDATLALEVCALLVKPARRKVELPTRYVGFEIEDRFVVGYGLDYAERYRNLPFVAALEKE